MHTFGALEINGSEIDATVEMSGSVVTEIHVTVESSGGAKLTPDARNHDYVQGVDLLLERAQALGLALADAILDSSTVQSLDMATRRLGRPTLVYPIELAIVGSLTDLRQTLLRSMGQIGRQPGASGQGNARKRFTLILQDPQSRSPQSLMAALRSGPAPR